MPGERESSNRAGQQAGAGGSGDDWPATLSLLLRLTGIGWYVAIAIASGALAGWWLDSRFGVSPALTLAGIALGVLVAFTGMIRMLRAVYRVSEKGRRRRAGRTDGGD